MRIYSKDLARTVYIRVKFRLLTVSLVSGSLQTTRVAKWRAMRIAPAEELNYIPAILSGIPYLAYNLTKLACGSHPVFGPLFSIDSKQLTVCI